MIEELFTKEEIVAKLEAKVSEVSAVINSVEDAKRTAIAQIEESYAEKVSSLTSSHQALTEKLAEFKPAPVVDEVQEPRVVEVTTEEAPTDVVEA